MTTPNLPVFGPLSSGVDLRDQEEALARFQNRPFRSDMNLSKVPEINYVEGLARSFFYGLGPGLIGIEASPELQKFQDQNPIASTVAEFAGSTLPYALPLVGEGYLGIQAASKLPLLGRLAKFGTSAEAISKAPFLTAAAREVARFAPLETTRVGLATLVADEGKGLDTFLNQSLQSAFNLSVAGVVGGGLGRLALSNPLPGPNIQGELKIAEKFPEFYTRNAAPQLRLRQLDDLVQNYAPDGLNVGGPGVAKTPLDNIAPEIIKTRQVLEEEILRGDPVNNLVAPFLGDTGAAKAKKISTLFGKAGETQGRRIQKFVRGESKGSFATADEAREALKLIGVESNADLRYIQYPRLYTTKTLANRENLLKELKGNFEFVGPNNLKAAWMTREKDGLYVVVKRVANRAKGEKAGDKYIFFKTDDPLRFFPEYKGALQDINAAAFKELENFKATAKQYRTQDTDYMDQLLRIFPENADYRGIPPALRSEVVGRALAKIHPTLADAPENVARFTARLADDAKEFVAPGISRFSDDPQAVRSWLISNSMFNRAVARTQEEFFGRPVFKAGTSAVGRLFREPELEGGIATKLKKIYSNGLDSDDVRLFNLAVNENLSVAEIGELGGSREVLELLDDLTKLDARKVAETLNVQKLTGTASTFTPKANYYMVSRTWRGNFRLAIRDDSGAIVAFGSGKTQALARKNADALIEAAQKRNPNIKLARSTSADEIFYSNREQDLSIAQSIELNRPAAEEVRKAGAAILREPFKFKGRARGGEGFGGYLNVLDEAEMTSAIYGNLLESNRLNASLLVNDRLSGPIARLASEAPSLHKQLLQTIALQGGKGETFGKGLDKAIDSITLPVLGTSAAEITRGMNRLLFNFTLGGDVGYVVLSALNPIQTVLPEIAWTLTAPPERLLPYYSSLLVNGRKTGPVAMYSLEPLKILNAAVKEMASGEAEITSFFQKGLEDGVITPKFIEEFVGKEASLVNRLGGVLKGERGVGEWLKAVSEYMASRAEEMSRGVAFLSGRRIAKDFMGLEGEAVFEFARNFTNRTMFMYQTADRPRMMTGAVGGFFGLFKNWSFHYIANMLNYGGEALRGNPAPFLWMMAGTGALGGAGALPAYGIADGFSRTFTDKSLAQNLYESFGYGGEGGSTIIPDAMFYGLPAFMGVSLQGRAAAPGAAFIRDVNMLTNFMAVDRATTLGAALGEAVDEWQTTGRHPVNSPKARDLFIRATLPRNLYRAASFTEDMALKSLKTGNRLSGPTSLTEASMYTFGLTPLDFDKNFYVSNELFEQQERMRDATAEYGEALSYAIEEQDWGRVKSIYAQAIAKGIPVDSLGQSARTRVTNRNVELQKRQFEEGPKRALQRALGTQN